MGWRWGHRKTTIISFGVSKGGGLIDSCVPDVCCRDLKQQKEKNAFWKFSEACDLYAPETRTIKRVAILTRPATNSGACWVRAIWRVLFRWSRTMYDACSMCTDSIICFKDTYRHDLWATLLLRWGYDDDGVFFLLRILSMNVSTSWLFHKKWYKP